MKPISYYGIILFNYLLVFGIGIVSLKVHREVDRTKLFNNVLAGIILSIITYIIKFMHEMGNTNKHVVRTNFEAFYFPVIEEICKVIIVWYQQGKCEKFSELNACFIWLSYVIITMDIYWYNPVDYEKHFKKFLKFYHLWQDQLSYRQRCSIQNEGEIRELLQSLDDKNKLRHSCSSEDSGKTLIDQNLQDKISIRDLPTEFKSEQLSISKSLPIPVEKSQTNKNYQSCSDFFDRLYSVSPKNTYHLNRATAIALEEDFCDLAKLPEVYENIDDEEETTKPLKRLFSWLLPANETIPEFSNENYPLLKSCLSKYDLNKSLHESQRFVNFQFFLSYYYDISISIISNLNIDPAFMKFGILLDQIPFYIIQVDELNYIVWQLILFLNVNKFMPVLIIIKLFKRNYLSTLDYKHNLLYQTIINVFVLIFTIIEYS